ncbi:MAG: glycosyltransferase family 2 protein [Patescibacteria group bacterium]
MKPITLIVLAKNEALHIERCLKSAKKIVLQIIVVDSGSTDGTAELAEKLGAEVFVHPFKNQAEQFNWALDNLEIKSDWILKLDADEYLTPELADEIRKAVDSDSAANGYYIKRRVYFMGRWIKHGGYYPAWFLRLWRKGKGRSEDKEMDEHIVLLEGEVGRLKNDFADDNRKGLKEWFERHKNYSDREARDVLKGGAANNSKRSFYYRLPPFLRPCLYFFYRFFIRLGFLDGKEGLIFHSLQGFWYRFLVDIKLFKARLKGK